MKYAVTRRASIDGITYYPGDFVTDPDRAVLLVRRGFLVPVEAYQTEVPSSDSGGSARPTYQELRARAKELGISAKGTFDELFVAVTAAELSLPESPLSTPSDEGLSLSSIDE